MFYDTYIKLCSQKGISPTKAAEEIGISRATPTTWKKRKLTPQGDTLNKIANYFGVTIDHLIGVADFDTASTVLEEDMNTPRSGEMDLLIKYRSLDHFGQKAVNDLLETEYQRSMDELQDSLNEQDYTSEIIYFSIPEFDSPMSAGTGEDAGQEYPDNLRLIKEPPPGASYVARIKGDSMEPTYLDGDRVFVAAWEDVYPGQVGVFLMDGKQWIKELGDGELISHNEAYEPRPMTEDIRCQGRVLGVCGKEYLE